MNHRVLRTKSLGGHGVSCRDTVRKVWGLSFENLRLPICVCVYIYTAAAMLLQSCPILCDPIDGSPPGSSIPVILQARTLEWIVIFFPNAWKWKVKVKSVQSCPTLRDPMDCSLPGSSIHGIFQARVLEWGAITFSHIWSESCVQLFVTSWTVAQQVPLSVKSSRQEYWSGLPFPSPGDFSRPGIEPGSPALQADSLPSELSGKPIYMYVKIYMCIHIL